MKRLGLICLVGAITLMGCVGRAPFPLQPPARDLQPQGPVVACRDSAEQRMDRELDRTMEGDTLEHVDAAVRAAVAAAGAASQVISLPEPLHRTGQELRAQGVTIFLEPTLEELRWEVPSWGRKQMTAFMLGVFTVGVGSVIYLNTSTEVYGHARLRIRMLDLRSLREQTQTYTGRSQARMSKLAAGRASTRSKMTSEALNAALDQFQADLRQFSGWER